MEKGGRRPNQSLKSCIDLALKRACKPQSLPSLHSKAAASLHPASLAEIVQEDRASALAKLLRETLKCPPDLHDGVLTLSGCGLRSADLLRVAEVLRQCPHIHTLDICNNPLIDDQFMRLLVEHVATNKHICRVLLDGEAEDDVVVSDSMPSVLPALKNRKWMLLASMRELKAALLHHCRENDLRRARRLVQEEEARQRSADDAMKLSLHRELLALVADEEAQRKQLRGLEANTRVGLQSEEHLCSDRLSSFIKKKMMMITHQRQVELVVCQELEKRCAVEHCCLVEVLFLAEADYALQRTFLVEKEIADRKQMRQEEKQSWVVARRKEKVRFAAELLAREELFGDETSYRQKVSAEYDNSLLSLGAALAENEKTAKAQESQRIEKTRKEEAARRRQEDLARERAEKEEAQRQKAIREFHLKQQQAREKVEADSMGVRKSVRALESAMSSAIFRVAAAIFPFFGSKVELERAARAYTQLLLEHPMVEFNMPFNFFSSANDTVGETRTADFGDDVSSNNGSPTSSPRGGGVARPMPHVFVLGEALAPLKLFAHSNYFGPHVSQDVEWGGSPLPTPHRQRPDGSAQMESSNEVDGREKLLNITLRDSWCNSAKLVQSEFKQKLSRMESARQSAVAKIGEELRALRLSMIQHRHEQCRWRVQFASSSAPASSPSSKYPSPPVTPPVGSHHPAASPVLVEAPAAENVSIPDPLAIDSVMAGTIDEYIVFMFSFGSQHKYLLELSPQLENDVISSPQAPLPKEPNVNTLRALKESVRRIEVQVRIEGPHSVNGTQSLLFRLPPESHGWSTDVQPPSKKFDRTYFLNGCNAHGSAFSHVHSRHDNAPPLAEFASVHAALARKRRLDIEGPHDDFASAPVVPPPDPIDPAVLNKIRQQYEFWSSTKMRSVVSAILPPVTGLWAFLSEENKGLYLSEETAARRKVELIDLVKRVYEYDRVVSAVTAIFDLGHIHANTPPPEVALRAIGENDQEASMNVVPEELKATSDNAQKSTNRNATALSEFSDFMHSIEFTAASTAAYNSAEFEHAVGLYNIHFDVKVTLSADLGGCTSAFLVLDRLTQSIYKRTSTREANEPTSSLIDHEQSFSTVIPVAVVPPFSPHHPRCFTSPIVLTKADVATLSKQATFSSSNVFSPHPQALFPDVSGIVPIPPQFAFDDHTLRPISVVFGRKDATPLVGLEVHVTVNPIDICRGAPEFTVAFLCDQHMWLNFIEPQSARKQQEHRSHLGTIFLSKHKSGCGEDVAILDIVSGSMVQCGSLPATLSASLSMSALSAARKAVRKLSAHALMGRKSSLPGTARPDLRQHLTLRVESELCTAVILEEVLQRLCAAAHQPSAQKCSIPNTPRGSTDTNSAMSSFLRVEAHIRPANASINVHSAHHTTAVAIAQDEHNFSPARLTPPRHSLLSPLTFVSDVPQLVAYVELLATPSLLPITPDAAPRRDAPVLAHSNLLVSIPKAPSIINVPFSTDIVFLPMQNSPLRIFDFVDIDHHAWFTFTISAYEDSAARTPMSGSRCETPTTTQLPQVDSTATPRDFPNSPSWDLIEFLTKNSFLSGTSSLLAATSEEDFILFVSIRAVTLIYMLGQLCGVSDLGGEILADDPDLLIPFATLKIEDSPSTIGVEIRNKGMREFLAKLGDAFDRTAANLVTAMCADWILSRLCCRVNRNTASAFSASRICFDVEVKLRDDQSTEAVKTVQKPKKGSKQPTEAVAAAPPATIFAKANISTVRLERPVCIGESERVFFVASSAAQANNSVFCNNLGRVVAVSAAGSATHALCFEIVPQEIRDLPQVVSKPLFSVPQSPCDVATTVFNV